MALHVGCGSFVAEAARSLPARASPAVGRRGTAPSRRVAGTSDFDGGAPPPVPTTCGRAHAGGQPQQPARA